MWNKEILLVDDEESILKSLRKDLDQHGYNVTTASSGLQAVTALRNGHYDIVVTDLIMTGMDGIQVLKETKKIDRKIGVIILTGYGDMASAIKALRLGADDYLLKPCDTDELLLRLSRCLEKRNLLIRLQDQNRKLSSEIIKRKRYESALEKNSEKIKLFAYSVAHDLKSPAININGLTKLLIKRFKDILPEKDWILCEQIMKSSGQIAALVDQINSYISVRESPFKFESVKLKELTRIIKEEFAPRLKDRKISWSEPKYLPTIKADRIALLRVLRNLVDNALKYGGDELHEISISYQESPESHIMAVKNDGIGIAKQDCTKIFKLFERQNASHETEGTGLGLAIVKEIADQHQGEVWAESVSDKGITFYMTIAKDL
jgi:K+-sensing histidine kinase KdpD